MYTFDTDDGFNETLSSPTSVEDMTDTVAENDGFEVEEEEQEEDTSPADDWGILGGTDADDIGDTDTQEKDTLEEGESFGTFESADAFDSAVSDFGEDEVVDHTEDFNTDENLDQEYVEGGESVGTVTSRNTAELLDEENTVEDDQIQDTADFGQFVNMSKEEIEESDANVDTTPQDDSDDLQTADQDAAIGTAENDPNEGIQAVKNALNDTAQTFSINGQLIDGLENKYLVGIAGVFLLIILLN